MGTATAPPNLGHHRACDVSDRLRDGAGTAEILRRRASSRWSPTRSASKTHCSARRCRCAASCRRTCAKRTSSSSSTCRANRRRPRRKTMSLRILVPAFMISELKRAFEIGFLLFLPLPDHRPRRRLGLDVDGHDDAAAGGGLAALQAVSLSRRSTAGRWSPAASCKATVAARSYRDFLNHRVALACTLHASLKMVRAFSKGRSAAPLAFDVVLFAEVVADLHDQRHALRITGLAAAGRLRRPRRCGTPSHRPSGNRPRSTIPSGQSAWTFSSALAIATSSAADLRRALLIGDAFLSCPVG